MTAAVSHVVGIDIGGTKCAAVAGRVEGDAIEILARESFATDAERGVEPILQDVERACEAVLAQSGVPWGLVQGVGVSCGGPLDSRAGRILGPPNLPGWDDVPIVDRLQRTFGVPVALQNDADAGALAEWRLGAGRGLRNMVFLTFGTGMGAGLILDGRLYSGTNSMAGEVGHVRLAEDGPEGFGKRGSFEGFCSGGGIARLAQDLAQDAWKRGEAVGYCPSPDHLGAVTAAATAAAADAGDPLARRVFALSGEKLGYGLAVLMDILNPEAIVIGSIFARRRQWLWEAAEPVLRREALERTRAVCRVVPAQLGEQIGDYASLLVALYRADGGFGRGTNE